MAGWNKNVINDVYNTVGGANVGFCHVSTVINNNTISTCNERRKSLNDENRLINWFRFRQWNGLNTYWLQVWWRHGENLELRGVLGCTIQLSIQCEERRGTPEFLQKVRVILFCSLKWKYLK